MIYRCHRISGGKNRKIRASIFATCITFQNLCGFVADSAAGVFHDILKRKFDALRANLSASYLANQLRQRFPK